MVVPSLVLFLLSILTLALAGFGVWTPWWLSFPDVGAHSGLFIACLGSECVSTLAISDFPIIIFIAFGCGATASVCLLFATVAIAVATLINAHVRALLKASFCCTLLGFLLLFATVGIYLLGATTSENFARLSFSAYLTFLALVLTLFQNILILSRHNRVSTEVAFV